MAYNRDNLTPIGNNAKRGSVPCVYAYWNEGSDTVTTSGFFTNVFEMKAADQVLVIDADGSGNTWYHVSSVTDGAATLVANS
jgi:hypothetical protein